MRLVSWNVNGLRACLKKGFRESMLALGADVICLQETKMERGQAEVDLPGYFECWNSAEKRGYSGTAVFTRREPLSVRYDMGVDRHDHEGRLITLEFEDFYLVNCYTPNAKRGLERLGDRMDWEDCLREYLVGLDREKPVVYCGDLNVAFAPIDLRHPDANRGNAGFTDEERGKLGQLFGEGFTDTFRALHPDAEGAYSWWSYRFHARENNAGWRIDYFVVSNRLMDRVEGADIYPEIMGSDHCPVELRLKEE